MSANEGIVVLEGLPAMGKTTIANLLRDRLGWMKVNESLGYLGGINMVDDQNVVFNETVRKYQLAIQANGWRIIDRGYPSLLGWDYCAEKIGYARDLEEKTEWINTALSLQTIVEPNWYIYLEGTPQLSLVRRPRQEVESDVWSGLSGMEYFHKFYTNFFSQPAIKAKTIKLDAAQPSHILLNQIVEAIR